jgi:hypothetical protein
MEIPRCDRGFRSARVCRDLTSSDEGTQRPKWLAGRQGFEPAVSGPEARSRLPDGVLSS